MNKKFIKLLALPMLFAGGLITASCTDYQSDIDEEARLRELGDRNLNSRADKIVTDLTAVKTDLQNRAIALNNRIDSLARVTKADSTSLAAEIAQVRTDLANLNADLQAYKLTVAGLIATTNATITRKADSIGAIHTADIRRIDGDILAIQGRLNTAETNINTINGQISTIQGDIIGINGDITTLIGRVNGHDNAFVVVNAKLDSVINAKNNELIIIDGKLNGLTNSVALTNDRIDSLNNAVNPRLTAMSNQLNTAGQNISLLFNEVYNTNGRIDSLNAALATELGTLTNNLTTLRNDVNSLTTRVTTLEANMVKVNARVDSLAGKTLALETKMIQSLVFVPEFEDGAITVDGTNTTKVYYQVMPANLATAIATNVANLKFVGEQVATRAATNAAFTINGATGNNNTGIIELTITPNNNFDGAKKYAFALEYNDGFAQYRTAYAPVYVVTQPTAFALNVEGIAAGATDVPAGTTIKLVPVFTPTYTNVTDVTYTSSDENVATVDADGTVHAHNNGTVTITATTKNGLQASVTLNVTGGTIVVNPSAGVNQEDAQ